MFLQTLGVKRWRIRAAAGAVVAMLAGAGCVDTVKPESPYATSEEMNVVSGRPDRDSSALAESENQLSAVRWGVLEKKGPRPAREIRSEQDTQINQGPATRPSWRVDFGPSTRPSWQEDDLPIRMVALPDGKVRILWTLRSYGGSLVTSSRDANTARRTVAITPPDLKPLIEVLTAQVGKEGSVLALPKENTLVITCDKAQRTGILDLLHKIDIPAHQVEIAARIFEVRNDFDLQTGANVLAKRIGADNSQTGLSLFPSANAVEAIAGAAPFQGGVMRLVKEAEMNGVSADVTFQILAEEGLIKLVSSPRITVAAGQTGYLLAGQELPVQTSSIVNNTLQIGTQYKPVGVQLYITPQVVGGDRVKLHTISIVSAVSGFVPLPNITGGHSKEMLVNPVIDSREAETAVTIGDGDTLVISGLRMMRSITRQSKIPLLGDIPVVGYLFKNERSQQQLTDLYFFVTPTLLDENGDLGRKG